jgi:hypothetical protein
VRRREDPLPVRHATWPCSLQDGTQKIGDRMLLHVIAGVHAALDFMCIAEDGE